MTEQAVPASATGLSSTSTILAEAAGGLAIVRMRRSAPKPSMLSDEENDRLLELLNELISARVQVNFVHDRMGAVSREVFIEENTRANNAAKEARRKMNGLLKKVRTAKSKTLDDILFKAITSEAVDFYECRFSKTLGHSIVNDLLSAECAWRD